MSPPGSAHREFNLICGALTNWLLWAWLGAAAGLHRERRWSQAHQRANLGAHTSPGLRPLTWNVGTTAPTLGLLGGLNEMEKASMASSFYYQQE